MECPLSTKHPKIPLMALEALEQVALQAHDGPIEKTKAIATCLAYLYSLQPCERWPFYEFWKGLGCLDAKTRSASINASLNGICLQLGVDRETKQKLSARVR